MRLFHSTAFGFAGLAAATLVAAQPAETGAPKLRQVCAADIQRLCPDIQPGHGAVMQCMRGHVSDVSPGCHAAIEARRAARRARAADPATPPENAAPSAPPN